MLNYAWSKFVRAAFIFRVHRSNLDVWSAEAACVRASTFRLFGSYGRRSAAGTESPNVFPIHIFILPPGEEERGGATTVAFRTQIGSVRCEGRRRLSRGVRPIARA